MKKIPLIFLISVMTISYSINSSAQANCDAIKKENEELKKALNLNEPIVNAKKGDLEYSITKVEGNIKAQSMTIEVNVKNIGKNLESFTTGVKSVLDPNGNEYLLDKAYIGGSDAMFYANKTLYRDAPLKCRYIFKGVQPEVKFIKLLNFPVNYHVPGTNSFDFVEESVELRDFKITWK